MASAETVKDYTVERIPSMFELSEDDIASLRERLAVDATLYLMDRMPPTSAGISEESPPPSLLEFDGDAAEFVAMMLKRKEESAPSSENTPDEKWKKLLGINEWDYNNFVEWFRSKEGQSGEFTQVAYDLDNTKNKNAQLLREFRAKEPEFWDRCSAQIDRMRATTQQLLAPSVPLPPDIDRPHTKTSQSIDSGRDLEAMKIAQTVEKWITARYMADVANWLLANNTTAQSSTREKIRVRRKIESLFGLGVKVN